MKNCEEAYLSICPFRGPERVLKYHNMIHLQCRVNLTQTEGARPSTTNKTYLTIMEDYIYYVYILFVTINFLYYYDLSKT